MSTESGRFVDRIAATDAGSEPSGGAPPGRVEEPISILLVDDEPKNLAVLETVLNNPNYRLVRAESADQALMALIVEEFALMVLDIQMPDMNGLELAQMIKQRKRTASLPIIFLTAYYSDESHVVEGYSTGAVDYLHKPINPTILRSKVAVFAELYRKTRECNLANRTLSAEVAERRRTQEELSVLAQELEERVAQRTSELERANSALRASEERFQLTLKNSRIFVYTTDRDLRCTWVSDQSAASAWRPILGSRDDGVLPPEQAAPLRDLKQRVLETGVGERAVFSFEIEGRKLYYDLTAEPFVDDRGARAGVAIAAMEITDLKQAESALREADRRKDEFLATLAHELRNPLAPIRNAIQILHFKGSTREDWQSAADVIDRQSRQMTHLVDDLLDISRITRGKLALRMQPVKLREAIEGAIETVRPLIGARGHQLNVDLPEEDLILNGDLTRLSQILSNLLNNAAKFTEPGGTISLSAKRDSGEVLISVKDNGAGIPAEVMPCVFQMFAQFDGHIDRSQGGLGIGLQLVKSLVEMHGGTIEASSAGAGQGSEFVVRLPLLLNSTAPAVDPPVAIETAANGRLRVLIVDDNRDNVESLRLLLVLMGHNVRVALEGLEGINAADEFRPDVVLLDIGMPNLDGHEVCRRIRARDWGRDMVLVAQTGWGQEEDRRRTQAAGFDYHLVKPIDHASLTAVFAKICEKSGALQSQDVANGSPASP
ncbi:MAG TPA: response regulator [Planctomycetaceae bacterium]|jgi:signal transduction histidine kinase|nr:response regulator [Planctomycetaceae bacterium]